jgi:signal peptidase II
MKRNIPYFIFVLIGAGLDQLTKLLIATNVRLFQSVTVIPGFFNITHIRNKGAIFGFLSHTGSRPIYLLLTAASLTALSFVIYYFFKTPPSERFTKIALSLILAGALGNLIDRLFRGYVIDFIDLHVRKYHWPFFNVADSCITIGALALFIAIIRRKA